MADHWGVRPPPDAAGPGVIKLEGDAIAASPPNPFIAKLMASPPLPPPDALESALGEWTPLEIQFVATLSVATFLALLVCSLRCWVRHVQARALADLPPPEKGTVAPLFCLFGDVTPGWYYGSDAVRSPIDRYRGPGDPPFEGP